MQLAPGAPLLFSVRALLPFARSMHFQARGIHDQVADLPTAAGAQVHLHVCLPIREQSVIRHRQVQPHQLENRRDKALGLPERRPVGEFDLKR